MARKFIHEEAYRGNDLLKKISSRQIVVCGVGALGSHLVDTLCRQGFSKIRVIDMDRVEGHNINTQLYGDSDVGALKVTALKNRMFRDVGVEIETFDKELTDSTIKKCFKGDPDLIVDTFDNRKSRKLVADYCGISDGMGLRPPIQCLHGGMFEDYGEIVWNDEYTVPQEVAGAKDICEYPLARNLVNFVVAVMAEEIVDFCVSKKPRHNSWSITLKDLSIRRYR